MRYHYILTNLSKMTSRTKENTTPCPPAGGDVKRCNLENNSGSGCRYRYRDGRTLVTAKARYWGLLNCSVCSVLHFKFSIIKYLKVNKTSLGS